MLVKPFFKDIYDFIEPKDAIKVYNKKYSTQMTL